MKYRKLAFLVLSLIVSFGLGRWYDSSGVQARSDHSKPLYYQCPMHPSTRSDKPGIAADCGMQLVPVYAENSEPANLKHGAVHVSPEKQQLIGVRFGAAEISTGDLGFRSVGQVVPDETHLYRLTARVEGTIRDIFSNSTGSFVHKGDPLVCVYSRDFQVGQQAYIFALNQIDRFRRGDDPDALDRLELALSEARSNLKALGMNGGDIEAIGRSKKILPAVKLVAPADGFIVARNVYADQRFDKGAELYRIVDLHHVWIMADLFDQEIAAVEPGSRVRATLRLSNGLQMTARVSNVLPRFDPETRITKIRLEADNPGASLKPDMFVDVDFSVARPASLSVPRDAVIDSGVSRTVFVDRGNGYFEPRRVETGWHSDGRVQIISGLKAGERIVVSGNFLIDSESRMQSGGTGLDDQSHN